MDHRSKYSYWDRDELLETVKETHQELHGERPEPGLYDELEIKALEDYQDLYGNVSPLCQRHKNIAGLDEAREKLVKMEEEAEALEKKRADAQSSNSKNNKGLSFEFDRYYENL